MVIVHLGTFCPFQTHLTFGEQLTFCRHFMASQPFPRQIDTCNHLWVKAGFEDNMWQEFGAFWSMGRPWKWAPKVTRSTCVPKWTLEYIWEHCMRSNPFTWQPDTCNHIWVKAGFKDNMWQDFGSFLSMGRTLKLSWHLVGLKLSLNVNHSKSLNVDHRGPFGSKDPKFHTRMGAGPYYKNVEE